MTLFPSVYTSYLWDVIHKPTTPVECLHLRSEESKIMSSVISFMPQYDKGNLYQAAGMRGNLHDHGVRIFAPHKNTLDIVVRLSIAQDTVSGVVCPGNLVGIG